METSILKSTKKILGIDDSYKVFDLDIVTHINTAFSVLHQLGIGPDAGFMIEDDTATWDNFFSNDNRLNNIKSYVYLKVRLMFDPPGTSFVLTSLSEQIKELEWRLNVAREVNIAPVVDDVCVTFPDGSIFDGGHP